MKLKASRIQGDLSSGALKNNLANRCKGVTLRVVWHEPSVLLETMNIGLVCHCQFGASLAMVQEVLARASVWQSIWIDDKQSHQELNSTEGPVQARVKKAQTALLFGNFPYILEQFVGVVPHT